MIKMCDTSRFHPHAHAWGISRQLLKGRHYTCSSNLESSVDDGIFEDLSIVHDQNLVTSKGLGVSLEYALYISALLLNDLKIVQEQALHIYYQGNFLEKVTQF